VGKKHRNPDWAQAKARCGLTDDDIRMAKELGMAPHSLIKNIPSRSQQWKAPVKEWVRDLHLRKFGAKEFGAKKLAAFPRPPKPAERDARYEPSWVESDAFGEGDYLERCYNDYLGQDHEPPTPQETEEQNAMMLRRQRNLRAAAEYVARELALFPEVVRVAMFGSVTQPLKKEIPRFSQFQRHRVPVWHECNDVDLAVWTTDLSRLKNLQKARGRALNLALCERDIGVPHFQVDVHILEPGTDRYRGRLCDYGECPKAHKEACLVDGCGAQPFLRQFRDYTFDRGEFWDAPKEILFERDPSSESRPRDLRRTARQRRITPPASGPRRRARERRQ
jgi:hypothetical protein